MITVRWYKNAHGQRNNWLRFGLMPLHRKGEIVYREHPLADCLRAVFHESVASHVHRHNSVIFVSDGTKSVKCIVDCEDSFFWMSRLIECADLYFCSGYNRDFFVNKGFQNPYAGLSAHEVEFYVRRAESLVKAHGHAFSRVRPFVPICPDTGGPRIGRLQQKFRNAYDKATMLLGAQNWRFAYKDFEHRYDQLMTLRREPFCMTSSYKIRFGDGRAIEQTALNA